MQGGAPGLSEASVRRLRADYEAGRFEGVITLGESLMQRSGTPCRTASVGYYTAMAYLQLGRPDPGELLLRDVKRCIRGCDDPALKVEVMAAESSLALLRQTPDVVDLALAAQHACRQLKPVPKQLELRTLNCVASAYLVAGEFRLAADAFEDAIRRMGRLFDMRRQAKLLNDAAIAYKELGEFDTATRYTLRAIELATVLRDSVNLARCENNLGWLYTELGRRPEARAHLERSLQLCIETGLVNGRSHVLLSLAELNFAEGDPTKAREFALEALSLAERFHEKPQIAYAHEWLGRIAEAVSEPDAADAEFQTAIALLDEIGSGEWLARCHRSYADVLERRGRFDLAYGELKQALECRDVKHLRSKSHAPRDVTAEDV